MFVSLRKCHCTYTADKSMLPTTEHPKYSSTRLVKLGNFGYNHASGLYLIEVNKRKCLGPGIYDFFLSPKKCYFIYTTYKSPLTTP